MIPTPTSLSRPKNTMETAILIGLGFAGFLGGYGLRAIQDMRRAARRDKETLAWPTRERVRDDRQQYY